MAPVIANNCPMTSCNSKTGLGNCLERKKSILLSGHKLLDFCEKNLEPRSLWQWLTAIFRKVRKRFCSYARLNSETILMAGLNCWLPSLVGWETNKLRTLSSNRARLQIEKYDGWSTKLVVSREKLTDFLAVLVNKRISKRKIIFRKRAVCRFTWCASCLDKMFHRAENYSKSRFRGPEILHFMIAASSRDPNTVHVPGTSSFRTLQTYIVVLRYSLICL